MGDAGWMPGLGRYPRERHGNPLQYSYLENPMNRGAWWAIVHQIVKRWTQLSDGACTPTFLGGTSGKESTHQWSQWKRHSFGPLVRMISWRRKWQLAAALLPGNFQGQRTLWAIVHGFAKSQTWLYTEHSTLPCAIKKKMQSTLIKNIEVAYTFEQLHKMLLSEEMYKCTVM